MNKGGALKANGHSAETQPHFNIGTSGLLVNQFGELLVILRNDTRTWALPGGALDRGELVTDGIIREVEEETGYKVLPVRLIAVHYIGFNGRHTIQFTFRCLMRGGVAKTSAESPKLGYVKTNPLAVPMLNFHKRQIEHGLTHLGAADLVVDKVSVVEQMLWRLLSKGIYPLLNLRRKLKREASFVPPDKWRVEVLLVIRDTAGAVLWTQDRASGLWQLPGCFVPFGEAPWDAAQRHALDALGLFVQVVELAQVSTLAEQNLLQMVFLAEPLSDSVVNGGASAEIDFLQPTEQLANSLPLHHEAVAAATDPDRELTLFRKYSAAQ